MVRTGIGLACALLFLACLALAARPAAAAPARLSADELDRVHGGDQWIVVINTNPYGVAKVDIGQPGVPPNTGLLCVNGFCAGPNGLVYLLRPLFF